MRSIACTAAIAALLTSVPAFAQSSPDLPPPPPPAPAGPMARAGYSLPWNLRPAIAADLVRADVALAFTSAGLNTATIVTGGARPFANLRTLGLYARVGAVTYGPDVGDGHATFVNPLVFGLFTPELTRGLRFPVFLGVTIPVGSGADASPVQRTTFTSGVYTRQAMDNALFAANFLTITAGAGLAYMTHGFTFQAEFTVLQLFRVWGESVDPDPTRTNFTTGAHVGYQIARYVTASVEAHYQHWLTTPAAVSRNDLMRSQFTVGAGVRGNIPAGRALIRPGVAFFMPTGGQMNALDYKVLQFDVAATF